MAPTIVIAAGGTAGHVVPALAVADDLRTSGAQVIFFGGDRTETELVPQAGYELRGLPVQGLSRSNPLKALWAAALAVRAVGRAWRLLGKIKPDAVMGGGGYVAGVVGLAAVLRRIPLVLTEADSHLGISNRMLARRARRVCLAFALHDKHEPRYLVTGRPVPPPFTDRKAARKEFGIKGAEKLVLVFGGSLGARSLNEAAVAAFADAPFRVLHASGTRDYETLRGKVARPGYDLRAYISPFGPALAAADLCVARAGGSVFEVAAHGLPAILVPYPHASADHQTSNAKYFAGSGAAVVITDAELTPDLLRTRVDGLLGTDLLTSMAEAAASLARPDAAHLNRNRGTGRHMSWSGRRIHMIGIGGAGMSGYARVCRQLGATVSGSDARESPKLDALRDDGVEVFIGHAAKNVPKDADVFYSSAIAPANPERKAAGKRGQPRAELLRELSALKRTIAIAGAHGKTTTSAMVTHVLTSLEYDPSYLVGGELIATGENAGWGTGEWLVAEADESDRSMLALNTEIAVILNIELEHHDAYKSLDELKAVYAEFAANATSQPPIDRDWPPPRKLELGPWGSRFTWRNHEVTLPSPGEHNAWNAIAALEACVRAGVNAAAAAHAMGTYKGVKRRFERVGMSQQRALVIDDYAHHSTEVAKTIAAARTLRPERVVAVFQPHLFSRTQELAAEFSSALGAADQTIVLPIFPARERQEDFPGVTSDLIAAAHHVERFSDAQAILSRDLRPRDLCLVMGAGDVDELARRLAQ